MASINDDFSWPTNPPQVIIFNLLSDNIKYINYPGITLNPSNCYTAEWKVRNFDDDSDMTQVFTTNFNIGTTSLEVINDTSNISSRVAIFGTRKMYLRATINSDPIHESINYDFTVDF